MNNHNSSLSADMSDQWERQQESLIYLTRCLLMIRSLSHGCKASGDPSIDALRTEATRKAINELADAAHNLPTIISKSMMHFVTLENGNPIKEDLEDFNRNFEAELCGLKRQLQMGLGESPVNPFQ